jgi:hypothetical protein
MHKLTPFASVTGERIRYVEQPKARKIRPRANPPSKP